MPTQKPQPANNSRTIIILAAILLAVVAAGIGAAFLLPSDNQPAPGVETGDEALPEEPATFNVSVLQRSDYNALNLGLLQNGQLPVTPPEGVGKANPFL